MIRNYLTTFVRILMRQKIYSAINVFGLSIGIAATLLISLYTYDELSYDRFHKDADRIYRITLEGKLDGVESNFAVTGGPVAEGLYKEIPAIESYVRINNSPITPLEIDGRILSLEKLILADSNFFEFFSFELLAGDKQTALIGPNKIVLTESSAKNIFNSQTLDYQAILGKIILLGEDKIATQVTGVAANPPDNSHFHFNSVLSMETDDPTKANKYYMGLMCYNYVRLAGKKNAEEVIREIVVVHKKLVGPEMPKLASTTLEEFEKNGNYFRWTLQPLLAIHLDSHLLSEIESNGNRTYLQLLLIIAAFILILACINFMNLATARAANRAKEVGIRKTVGARQKRLITQFMFESFVYTLLALFIALALVSIFIAPFNVLAHKNLTIDQLFLPEFKGGIAFMVILITLLAGSYPSFYIASFRPSEVLKGKLSLGSQGSGLRNSMVVFQFVISTTLIMATILVYRQLTFLQTLNPGFNKENVLCLRNTLSLKNNADPFKNELKSNRDFVDASFSSRLPSEIITAEGLRLKGDEKWQTLHSYEADADYLKTLGLTVISGRFFSTEFPSDSDAVVINEATARLLGIKDLHQQEYIEHPGAKHRMDEIIGIIQNFNFESLKSEIKPLVIYNRGDSRMSIRLTPGDVSRKVEVIKQLWSKHSSAPFEYSFLDENLNTQYESEEQLQRISIVFTVLSVVIACLGLLGLVTYMASQRTKEIGIRKVMGASVQQVVMLLSKDFVRLVLIAFIIAVPVSWYGMNQWLKTFAYRINFDVTLALAAGATILVIALLTVSYQSIKAARGNPVNSLRSE